MNKEQAIEALLKQPLGGTWLADPRQRLITVGDAINILRALPDETPTVLTREMIDGVIDRERCRCGDPIRDQSQVVGMRRLARALLALGPVVVEGAVECAEVKLHGVHWSSVVDANGDEHEFTHCPLCGTRLQGGEG